MGNDRIGAYKLISRLGSGGTGTVFKAYQETLGRTVALKVLHPGYGRNASLVKRFKREIQTSAALNHPYLVKVYDAGEEGEHHYFSMEFVEGEPLRARLKGGQKMTVKDSIKVAQQMSDALSYFHSMGLIHRDIKPENIMLDGAGNVKLMDFGIVKVNDSTVITQEGSTLGTPRYMSPEMVMGEQQDLRSDIFQLGVVLYEMVTGKCPFDGPTISAIATQITDNPPPAPSLIADAMPPALEAVVLKCLEKDPVNRYLDAEALSTALKQAELASISGAGVAKPGSKQGAELPRRIATFKMSPEMMQQSEGNHHTVMDLPANLQELPKFVEKSFRSVKMQFEEQPALQKSLVIAPLAFVAGLAIIWMVAGGRGHAVVGPITVVEGMTGIRAHWKTRGPGLTEVEISDAEGQPRRFRNSTEQSVVDHSIAIKDLRRGGEYSVRVVHPDGSRSDPVKVVLPAVDKLISAEPQVAVKGPGAVEIALRTNARAHVSMHGRREGEPFVVDLSNGWTQEHKATIDKIGPNDELTDLKLVVEGADDGKELALSPLMGGARLAGSLKSALSGMKPQDVEQIATRLNREMAIKRKDQSDPAVLAEKRRKNHESGRAMLRAWLREKRLAPLVESMKLLSPWVFGAGTELEAQIEAYTALMRLEDLEFLGHELVRNQLFDVAIHQLYRPFAQVDHVMSPGEGRVIVDNMQKDRVSLYMSRRYRTENSAILSFDGRHITQGKMDGLDLSAVSAKFESSTDDAWDVGADDLAGAERVRFVFQIANMRPDVYLDIGINDKARLRVRCDPAKVHEYDMTSMFQASESLETRSTHVAVTVPARLLQPGRNHINVSVESIPGVSPSMGGSLLRVYFRVEPRGA